MTSIDLNTEDILLRNTNLNENRLFTNIENTALFAVGKESCVNANEINARI